MIKQRVMISYGVVFLFIFVLIVINALSSNGILGFVIKEDNALSAYSPGFAVYIKNYNFNGNNLDVEYTLSDSSGKSHQVDLNYEIYDGEGQSYISGTQRVVIGASSKADYNLNIRLYKEIPYGAVLILEAREGILRTISSKSLRTPVNITGDVVSNSGPVKIAGIFVFFVFILGILYYGLKFARERNERKRYINSLHDRNLVRLKI